MKTHYDTLGVRRDATKDAIKAEYRKLSMEVHPDVGGSTACAERFKEISAAANVLMNDKRRRAYDYQLREAGAMGRGLHKSHQGGFGHPHRTGTTSRPGPGVASTPMQIFVSNIMRPRSFVVGFAAVLVGAYAFSYIGGEKSRNNLLRDGPDLVKAWKNPETGVYEQPTPWDPVYRSLNPTLVDVPRELVRKRHR